MIEDAHPAQSPVYAKKVLKFQDFFCDPNRIQTCNLLIRSQMLYSVKLWGRDSGCCLISCIKRFPL